MKFGSPGNSGILHLGVGTRVLTSEMSFVLCASWLVDFEQLLSQLFPSGLGGCPRGLCVPPGPWEPREAQRTLSDRILLGLLSQENLME